MCVKGCDYIIYTKGKTICGKYYALLGLESRRGEKILPSVRKFLVQKGGMHTHTHTHLVKNIYIRFQKKKQKVVIDALRFDFVAWNETADASEPQPYYQNQLKSVRDALTKMPQRAKLFELKSNQSCCCGVVFKK